MKAASAIAAHADWEKALSDVLARTKTGLGDAPVDLALLFVNSAFESHYSKILELVRGATDAKLVAGCGGYGVIGQGTEIEAQPAISLMLLSLPGAQLTPFHFKQKLLEDANGPAFWHVETGVLPDEVNGWLMFADPYHLDCERLIQEFNQAYPNKPLLGGMASSQSGEQKTHVFLNGLAYDSGAIGLAVGGTVTVQAVVSQGCTPIGEPWIITRAERNIIQQIGSYPAFQILTHTLQTLPRPIQERLQNNLFVGLVLNEYQEEYRRGDFLIRNLLGIDPKSGVIAIGAVPRVGQTLQFQMRDGAAADEELRKVLDKLKQQGRAAPPIAGLLCSCNGRGKNLFGVPNHDAGLVSETLGPLPLTGFFCNGEIGPVDGRNFLHGFSAVLGLFVPASQ